MIAPLAALAALLTATIGTWIVRQYLRARNVLDVPNERSSHTIPTPRGGGAAIVVAVLLGVVLLWILNALAADVVLAIVGGGSAVAAIGFLDDHRPVSARVRLAVHFMAAGWVLYCLHLPPAWYAITNGAVPDWLGYTVSSVALVWLLNLVNFMDGIDGLAATEAVTVCFAGAAIVTMTRGIPLLAVVVGAASLGFLVWNFPPASIFMGDVGSGFLGLLLGITGLAEFANSVQHAAAWLILLAVFITDASVTLFRRWQRGDSVASAHRTHAYQHAVRRCGSHRMVTLLVATMNLFWLLPVAWLVHGSAIPVAAGLLVAFTPLIAVAWHLGAGTPRAER